MSEILEQTSTKLVRFDWAIKHLLRNKANFDILEGFLSELLKTSIKIERMLESESNKNHYSDKYNRVDLLAITEQNQHIIIELQCSSQWDYLSRILYGASKVVCEYLSESDTYSKIRKIISISIVFFNLGEGQDYLYKGSTIFKGLHYGDDLVLNSREKKAYCEANYLNVEKPESIFPEYYIIKVTQFREKVKDKLDEWIYFLKNGKIEKAFEAQGLQKAKQKLDILKLNEQERREYNRYLEGLHDDASFRQMVEITKKEVRAEVRAEVQDEVRAEVRAEVQEEVREEVRAKVHEAILKEVRAEVHEKVREEIRAEVQEEVREEVRAEIKEEAREEVRAKVHEAVLKEVRAEVRKEIRTEVDKGTRLEIARTLKLSVFSDIEIAKITQLTLEEIKNL